MSMHVFKEGIVTSNISALNIAKKILKKKPSGTKLFLSFYNGTDLFIKVNNEVRVCTEIEYKDEIIKANKANKVV